ncbi:MAG TPA: terpene synthase family protein [Archangium sp.]|jgi:hypothetical protein|uniref:terpene synthase family protein n=1 Tax=Archangium sp. TaxID=1872627 RepID=UPI002ED91FCA
MNAAELLEPYRAQMLDERHWELTRRLLDWSLRHTYRRLEPAFYVREAFVSSTFEQYCCPPEATLEENLLGAWFVTCIFKADDGSTEELTSFLAAPDAPSAPTELRACHASFMEALQREGRDTEGPRAAFRELCAWTCRERGMDSRTVTEAQYRECRNYTIGVPAYVACWAALRGLTPSERAQEALRGSGLLEATMELVYSCNDLGSVEKDEAALRKNPSGGDLNLVLLRARDVGDREEAIRQVVAHYHERARDFLRLRAELASTEHWRERHVRDFVELLRCVTNGNLHTTRHLMATRYPGAQALLATLPELEPFQERLR